MTDRDHFAAAALTGLLARVAGKAEAFSEAAYKIADAMLRERERTNHDAAPAARAESDEARTDKAAPSHRRDGTGNNPAPPCVENTRDQQPRTKEAAHMSDENERSVGSAGSVAERPLGDPDIALEILRLRVAELEEAIRRLADQDATLSVVGGNVIVQMDATLTDAEREAVEWCVFQQTTPQPTAVCLRRLLERLS